MNNENRYNQEPIKIMYIEAEGGVIGAKNAFDELENRLEDLHGRKFYEVVYNDLHYWAAVAMREDDKPEKLGLKVGEIQGGEYIKKRIYNWIEHIHEVKSIFENMAKENKEDTSRPRVEFYQGEERMVLWLPIK